MTFRTETERLWDRIFNTRMGRVCCACGDWADYMMPDYQMDELVETPCQYCGGVRDWFDVTDEYERPDDDSARPQEGR